MVDTISQRQKNGNHKVQEFKFTYKRYNTALMRLHAILNLRRKEFDNIYAIPRGGYMLAIPLSHKLNMPLVNKPSSRTLIVDDILDTGKTLKKYPNNKKVVLIVKPKGLHKIPNVIYDIKVKDEEWVSFWWEEQNG
jgi:hypoxanthine phosphoribosyltransferase